MRKTLLTFLSLFFLLPSSIQAVHFQSGESLTLPQDKTFNESVFVAAQTLTINSPITGDLYCAGRDIVINAPVTGDIICAGETIKVSGKINGNLRLAARTIDTDANVGATATLASENLTLRTTSTIAGDLFAAASVADISGKFSRDLAIASKNFKYSGQLIRNAQVYSSDLSFGDTAKINGSLDLYTPTDSQVNIPAGSVVGATSRHEIKTEAPDTATTTPSVGAWLVERLWSILSFLLVGLLLLQFARPKALISANIAATRPFASFFIGFAVLVLTPIAFLIALFTIVGIPAAFIVIMLYIVGLMIASVITAILLGHIIITNFVKNEKFQTPFYYLFLGLPLLWIICGIPQVGGLVTFVSLCLGLGAYFLSFLPNKDTPKAVVAPDTPPEPEK